MSVDFVRPRVADLVFQVYGRPLHPELFEILTTRTIVREDYKLRLHITRTGHVITWENNNILLTEVATAPLEGYPLAEKRRLLHYRMRGEHCGRVECLDNVSYQMSFQIEAMQPEIFAHTHEELLADGQKRGLLHNFQPNHRLAMAPLGLILVEARPRMLSICTFHTFPAENTVVKSQSLIERRS